MNTIVKNAVQRLIKLFVVLMAKTSIGRYISGQIIDNVMDQTKVVVHQGVKFKFAIPNKRNKFRVKTFSTKEPETLEWIDGIDKGSVLWDIGANVGLYSCYAAKRRDCRVFAFEPSVFNLELLARNIFLNDLSRQITIVPLPLTDTLTISSLNMTRTDWGGALSTFDKSYGFDGQAIRKIFEFSTIGMSLKDAIELIKIPKPDYIKMDVDGIEHLILKGGDTVIKDVKSVLVEINDQFKQQADEATRYLREAGLCLKEKRRWKGTDNTPFQYTYNQIWHREISH